MEVQALATSNTNKIDISLMELPLITAVAGKRHGAWSAPTTGVFHDVAQRPPGPVVSLMMS